MSKAEIEFAAENAQKLNDLISRSALLEKSFSTAPATMINPYGGESVVRVEDIENAPAVDAEKVYEHLGLVKKALDMAHADLVPVVRCKDCKHSRVWENNPMTCAFWTDQWDMPTEPNAFCSYGERRADHG